jgi:ubiquinone/menaquinone biosynthesis C-methylase UbiE
MSARDIFQSISDLGPDAIQKIVDRLEYRGSDPTFVRMRETYLHRMRLTPSARILDCGCGTGVVSRALAQREGFAGAVVGIDFSDALIEAARRLAREKGLGDRIEFRVGDAQALEDPDDSYDFVIAHTLISHVADPARVISEASRVVRANGTIAIFDGDYASLAYGAGDAQLNAKMVNGILAAVVANPHVMRQVPMLLRDYGLEVLAFLPELHAEAGEGAFFSNLAESYVPMAVRAGTISSETADHWLATQRDASSKATFFAACNYYTYLARKPR